VISCWNNALVSSEQKQLPKPGYLWPWFLLAGVLLGVLLAVIWITAEVRRLKEQRQYDVVPSAKTNSPSAAASSKDSSYGICLL